MRVYEVQNALVGCHADQHCGVLLHDGSPGPFNAGMLAIQNVAKLAPWKSQGNTPDLVVFEVDALNRTLPEETPRDLLQDRAKEIEGKIFEIYLQHDLITKEQLNATRAKGGNAHIFTAVRDMLASELYAVQESTKTNNVKG